VPSGWLSVPAGGDRGRGALVLAIRDVTIYRWVQTFTPQFIDAARPARHATGDRWFLDETYVKVAGRWTYLYRAIDQHGQVIDVLMSPRRNAAAARSFLARALHLGPVPVEVVTDRAPAYPQIIDELAPAPRHVTEPYATDENVNGAAVGGRLCCIGFLSAAAGCDRRPGAVASGCGGRGRPRSEEQDVGTGCSAALLSLRAARVASRCWRPRPPSVCSIAASG
jgi:DDE superfamily endonuclease